VDESVKENLRSTLMDIFEKNSQVLMISLTTPEGLPILLIERTQENNIEEIIDSGVSNRYAALAGASTSLGDRTLSTLSQENVRLIHVLGVNRDIAISVSKKLIVLVVTVPTGSANLLADKLANTLKLQI
jgi:predicted regulator of Ras-like GTPase activity (Roadblock/LC7/MglB family)